MPHKTGSGSAERYTSARDAVGLTFGRVSRWVFAYSHGEQKPHQKRTALPRPDTDRNGLGWGSRRTTLQTICCYRRSAKKWGPASFGGNDHKPQSLPTGCCSEASHPTDRRRPPKGSARHPAHGSLPPTPTSHRLVPCGRAHSASAAVHAALTAAPRRAAADAECTQAARCTESGGGASPPPTRAAGTSVRRDHTPPSPATVPAASGPEASTGRRDSPTAAGRHADDASTSGSAGSPARAKDERQGRQAPGRPPRHAAVA